MRNSCSLVKLLVVLHLIILGNIAMFVLKWSMQLGVLYSIGKPNVFHLKNCTLYFSFIIFWAVGQYLFDHSTRYQPNKY